MSRYVGFAVTVSVMTALFGATALVAEESDGRTTLERVGAAKDYNLTRGRLASIIDVRRLNSNGDDIAADDFMVLQQAMQHVRALVAQGFTDDAEFRNGKQVSPSRFIPGLTGPELAMLSRVDRNSPSTPIRNFGTAHTVPNHHRQPYFVFDIDRIEGDNFNPTGGPPRPGTLVHRGEPSIYEVDVSIPVKPVYYERQVSTISETGGFVGGWTPEATTQRPHYRIALDQFAVRRDGTLADDPSQVPPGQTAPLVTLQIIGPGDWLGDPTVNSPANQAKYSYDEANRRFRVPMALTGPQADSSPNVFPGGGHVHCGYIYDFANPLNCHKVARSGDPSTRRGDTKQTTVFGSTVITVANYGDTVVLPINNSGRDS